MLKHWSRYGGVMIVGYSMYRNLSQCYRVRSKHQKKIFQEALVDPGEKSSIISYFPLFSSLEDLLPLFFASHLGSSNWSYFTVCTPYISGITTIKTINLTAQVFRNMLNFTPVQNSLVYVVKTGIQESGSDRFSLLQSLS